MPRRTPQEPVPVKGQEIRIVSGNYKGVRAWKNDAKTQPLKMVYVIIELEDGTERTARIRKSSVGGTLPPPNSFEEACLQQKPEIEEQLRLATAPPDSSPRKLLPCVEWWTGQIFVRSLAIFASKRKPN